MRQTRKSMRRRNFLVEACETRVLFDQTPWNMAVQGQLTQNWSNTGMITVNNNWSTVPSIEGYNGNGLTGSTGVDPRTVLGAGPGTLFVTANQTNPDIANAAGVGEFEIADPVVALSGSGTANAPFLIFYLNATGQSNIPMSFKLRDIETLDTGVQQVSVQYRLATTGTWTDMGALASTGTNATVYTAAATGTGTPETNVAFTLPSACDNASILQIRVITTNAAGSDQWVGVDNVVIGGSTVQAPTFKLDASSYQVNETAGTITVNVLRELNTTGTDTINYATTDITATSGSDYTGASGLLTFNPGETTKPIVINIANDVTAENAETFTFALSNPSVGGALGAPNSSTVTIVDNDSFAPSSVRLNELSVNPPTSTDSPFEYIEVRGDASSALLNTYVVQLTGNTAVLPGAAGVAYRVFDIGTATLGTSGLLVVKSTTGGFTIPAGTNVLTSTQLDLATSASGLRDDAQTWAVVYSPIPITQATDYDPSGSGTLSLPAGAQVLDSVGWGQWGGFGWDGVIYSNAIVNPSQSGTSSNPADATTAVSRFRNDTTADSASAWFGGVLGGTTNDSTIYGTTLTSSNIPAGAIITPGSVNYPNMVNGSLVFDMAGYSVNESAGTATVIVNRVGGSTGSVSVNYATIAGGTATAGSDYTTASGTLTFGNGVTSQSFTVNITPDSLYEGNETITLQLSNPTGGAETTGATGTLTVVDDDPIVTPSININEIDVDPPSTDNPFEYVELIGANGASLNNVYFLAVEGDNNTNLGKAVLAINLSGASLGSNGLAMLKAISGGHAPLELGTNVIGNALFSAAGGSLQGGSHSFMIVFSPTTAIATNAAVGDVTGALTGLPADAVVLDSVGWLDSTTNGDKVYGGVDLSFASPTTSNIPGAATRIVGNSASLSSSAWYYGALSGSTGSGITYAAPISANTPAGAVLTPGGANFVANTDTTPPTVSSKVYDFNTSGAAPSITVTFSEPVQNITLSDLASSSFTITNRTGGATIPAANFTLTPVSTSVYKITFVGANNAPADGDFKLTINAANVKDLANNALAANESLNYTFLQGDANADRKVNTLDFNLLAGNFGPAGKTFSQGDFSFNGTIDSTDFTILVGQYGKKLVDVPPPAPTLGAVVGGTPTGSIFGSTRVDDLAEGDSILA